MAFSTNEFPPDDALRWTRKDGQVVRDVELGDWDSQLTPGVGDQRIHGLPHGVLSRQFSYPSVTMRAKDEAGAGPKLPFDLNMIDYLHGSDAAQDIGPTTDWGSQQRVTHPTDFGSRHVNTVRARDTGFGEFRTPEGAAVRGDDVDLSRDTLKAQHGSDRRKSSEDIDYANSTANAQGDFYSLMKQQAENNAFTLINFGRTQRLLEREGGADFAGDTPDPVQALNRNEVFRAMQNPN